MLAPPLDALHKLADRFRLVPLRLIGRCKLELIHDVVPAPFLTDAAGSRWRHDVPWDCTATVWGLASANLSATKERLAKGVPPRHKKLLTTMRHDLS